MDSLFAYDEYGKFDHEMYSIIDHKNINEKALQQDWRFHKTRYKITISWKYLYGNMITPSPEFYLYFRRGHKYILHGKYIEVSELIKKNCECGCDLLYEFVMQKMPYTTTNQDKLALIASILKSDMKLDNKFWDFVPTPLPGLQRHLYLMNSGDRNKMIAYMTKRARHNLEERYSIIYSYIQDRSLLLEPEIIDKIILRSFKR